MRPGLKITFEVRGDIVMTIVEQENAAGSSRDPRRLYLFDADILEIIRARDAQAPAPIVEGGK